MPLKSEPGEQKKEKKHPNNVSAAVLGISGSLVFRTKKRRVSNGAPTRVVRFLNSASVTRGKERKEHLLVVYFNFTEQFARFSLASNNNSGRRETQINTHTHAQKNGENRGYNDTPPDQHPRGICEQSVPGARTTGA